VLRYHKCTADLKLVFLRSPTDSSPLVGFTDSDFAGDINGRNLQGGYIFKAYDGPVSWKSHQQSMVALSTTEAEYVACSNAAQEAQRLVRNASRRIPYGAATARVERAPAERAEQGTHPDLDKRGSSDILCSLYFLSLLNTSPKQELSSVFTIFLPRSASTLSPRSSLSCS
jgi:hypothetical protein